MTSTRPHRPGMRGATARGLAALLAVAAVAALPGSAGAAAKKLKDIVVTPATATVIPGRTQAYQATGVYSDGTSVDLTAQVVWKVRDPRVATIDAAGTATGVASGRTDVSATLPAARVSSRKAARIEVAELDAISVEPATAIVRVGGEMVLKAIGTYDDGTTGVDITAQVRWASKKTSVVRIAQNADGATVAAGIATGETVVEARDPVTGVRSSSTTGKVKVVGKLVSIDVAPDTRQVRVGERLRFRATGTFERGLTADVSLDVDWSTGDAAIATADAEGRVTGVSVGSTAVIATDSTTGISSTASAADGRVDVVGDMLSLAVKPSPLSMTLGTRANLKAHGTFEGIAKPVNVTTKVEWSSSDPSKVSLSRVGVASCLAAGTVLVSARDPFSGLTSTASGTDGVVRCGVPVVGVSITPATHTMRVGKTKKVKAFLLYADGSRDEITKRVVWGSSNAVVASVDTAEPNIGRVHALASGTAVVTADDPLTGFSSTAPGGQSLTLTVP